MTPSTDHATHYPIQRESTWDATLDPETVLFELPEAASTELRNYLRSMPQVAALMEITELETVDIHRDQLPQCIEAIAQLELQLKKGPRLAILKSNSSLSFREQIAVPWVIGGLMGNLLEQNEAGDRAYLVRDQGGKMEQGARYSQTNQGGSFHTDGVNLKSGYDYFLLHCIAPADQGGESILLNGLTVLNVLQSTSPDTLRVLEQELNWEYKGIYRDKYYREPIVKVQEGELIWRYLRDYIEEAARKTGNTLSAETIRAMDQLDVVLDDPKFQFRYKLRPGETAIINDRQIFHGRTPFRDAIDTISLEDYLKDNHPTQQIKRTYSRFWVTKAPAAPSP